MSENRPALSIAGANGDRLPAASHAPHLPPSESGARVARFNRWCLAVAFVWSVGVVPATLLVRASFEDFSSVYMGGVMARAGAWADLYPTVKPPIFANAGYPQQSVMRPRYAELADERGVGQTYKDEKIYRYILPPPAALFLMPLAFLPYHAAGLTWAAVLGLCVFAVARQASQSYERLAGRPTRLAGVVALLVALSLIAARSIRGANMTPFVAFILGAEAMALLRGRDAAAAVSAAVGGVVKYMTAVLLPVALVLHRWRAVVGGAVLAAALVGLTLLVEGVGPFKVFYYEISPTLICHFPPCGPVLIREAVAALAHCPDDAPAAMAAVKVLQWGVLAGVLGLMLVKRESIRRSPAQVLAACAALVCWLLAFSPIFDEHYVFYLCPFWGYLAWEATRGPARRVVAVLIFALQFAPWPNRLVERFPWRADLAYLGWGSVALLLLLAIARLASRGTPPALDAVAEPLAGHDRS